MISLIFDLDDTLYFQRDQFEQAVIVSGLLADKNKMTTLYENFRLRSEANYLLHDAGKITLADNRLRRIQEAFSDIGVTITDQQALSWQTAYEHEVNNLTLQPLIAEMLTECKENQIQLGIITNGPSEHQRNKIKALGLERWFLPSQIVVSGDLGISKPAPAIFQQSYDQLPIKTRKYYYIGDNYVNDILGATKFGWQTIWLNSKQEVKQSVEATHEVHNHKELVALISTLIR